MFSFAYDEKDVIDHHYSGGNAVRIGIIGTGHMGGMLARAWTHSGDPQPIHIYNRSLDKARLLYEENPHNIIIEHDLNTLVSSSEAVFLCLKAKDTWDILPNLARSMSQQQYLLTTGSAIPLEQLEEKLPCYVIKLIPSITQYALAGIQLVMFGSRFTPTQQTDMLAWLAAIGTPVVIHEKDIRICSDLTSCGPAFLADWLLRLAKAAKKEGLPATMALYLVQSMAAGVGQLLAQGTWNLEDILAQVAMPGGVTSAGLTVLRAGGDDIFSSLFAATRTRQVAISQTSHNET